MTIRDNIVTWGRAAVGARFDLDIDVDSPGPAGPAGPTGPAGPAGADGADGAAGSSRTVQAEQNSDFTAEMGTVVVVDNSGSPIVITLPATTVADVGKDILFVFREAPGTQKITVQCPALDETINSQASAGSEVAKAVFNTSTQSYDIGRAVLVADNQWVVGGADQTFAELIYSMLTDDTNWQNSGDHRITASAVPAGTFASGAAFWFAIKLEREATAGGSDPQMLFGTNLHGLAYQDGGGAFACGNYDSAAPNTFNGMFGTDVGGLGPGWIVGAWDGASWDVWCNGAKAVDGQTGATFSATTPTDLTFGMSGTTTSFGGYHLYQGSVGAIMVGTGAPSDAQIAELTTTVYADTDLSAGLQTLITNAWTVDGSGFVTNKGAISLTAGVGYAPTQL